MHIPPSRGPLSAWLASRLAGDCTSAPTVRRPRDLLADHDLQLALWIAYELHYRGFDEVDDDLEWAPDVLAFRGELEKAFLDGLRTGVAPTAPTTPDGVASTLAEVTGQDTGRSLSSFLQRRASAANFGEFVAHRSVYHLKEADPHTFAIPRLRGAAKAAMVEIQTDEYGGGRPERMHATLFARLMDGLGLDTTYGAYVARVPGITLATSNVMSLFGLHRRWRGAAAGHLAALEMTSSLPNRRYGQGLRRLGGSDDTCEFFDEHVEADAVHEQIAAHDLCTSLARDEPRLADDIVFGAACCMHLEQLFADHLLDSWEQQATSLSSDAKKAA